MNKKIYLSRVNLSELLQIEEIYKYEMSYHKDFTDYLTLGLWIDDNFIVQYRFELQCKFCENSKLKFSKKKNYCKCKVCKKEFPFKESIIGKILDLYI